MCTSVGEKIVKEKGGDVTIEKLLNSLSGVLCGFTGIKKNQFLIAQLNVIRYCSLLTLSTVQSVEKYLVFFPTTFNSWLFTWEIAIHGFQIVLLSMDYLLHRWEKLTDYLNSNQVLHCLLVTKTQFTMVVIIVHRENHWETIHNMEWHRYEETTFFLYIGKRKQVCNRL